MKKYYMRVKEKRNILHTVQRTKERRKANWIGHISRRNCLLKHVVAGKIDGKVEVMGRRRRRPEQLLNDLKEWR
jgi:phosphatidylserine/phosphatidylglycerophosphate/cardiolipin synthase-like enzyme